jgi:hypothetical protein
MVELTAHDSAILSRLVQFGRLPVAERESLLKELQSPDARMVGEAVLEPKKYAESSKLIQETVDRFTGWLDANRELGRKRTLRRRAARSK